MAFSKRTAQEIARQQLAPWKSASYKEALASVDKEWSTVVAGADGVEYLAWAAVRFVNEDDEDIEVECLVTEKDGRNTLPPQHSANVVIAKDLM